MISGRRRTTVTAGPIAARARMRAVACALAIGWALFGVGLRSASAHPVPRSEYDRNITIDIRPDLIRIVYRLELDEFTLLKLVGDPDNGFPIDRKGVLTPKAVAEAFIARMKVVIPDQLLGQLNGKPLAFQCIESRRDESADSVLFRFVFKADRAVSADQTAEFDLEDLNFADKVGRFVMKFENHPSLTFLEVDEPAERKTTGNPLEKQRRGAWASFKIISSKDDGPGPTDPKTPSTLPAPPGSTDAPDSANGANEADGFWKLLGKVRRSGLKVLFDSPVGWWTLLLLAMLHGAMHSAAPGHGKTMVAAYLVGEQGTAKHAVILGMIVTLTHTSSAFIVALLLKFALPVSAAPTVQAVLGFVGGLTVAFVGLWLVMSRLKGNGHGHGHGHNHGHSHSHGGGGEEGGHGHSHSHGHEHSHGVTPEDFRRFSWPRLILLGISGGVVPCWGAILWVIYCVSAGRFGTALSTVTAFSVGLASVLVLLGLTVVYGVRFGGARFAAQSGFGRRLLTRILPIVGAVVVIAIGLWMCFDALHVTAERGD